MHLYYIQMNSMFHFCCVSDYFLVCLIQIFLAWINGSCTWGEFRIGMMIWVHPRYHFLGFRGGGGGNYLYMVGFSWWIIFEFWEISWQIMFMGIRHTGSTDSVSLISLRFLLLDWWWWSNTLYYSRGCWYSTRGSNGYKVVPQECSDGKAYSKALVCQYAR